MLGCTTSASLNKIPIEKILSGKENDVLCLLEKHFDVEWKNNADLHFYVHASSEKVDVYKVQQFEERLCGYIENPPAVIV